MQCEEIFDIAPTQKSSEHWELDFDLPDQWNVGLIVEPSGSGKSTLLKEAFPLSPSFSWSEDKSILDDFPPSLSIKEILELLCSVGFSSPPSWLRPHRVLSNGEQFRVILARILAESQGLVTIDEFTSVVNRTVAQIASAAFQKTVRRRNQQAVLASCHYDILEWLEPDWVFEPHLNKMQWGRLWRRPEIKLEIYRVHHSAWRIFRKHHYLDTTLNRSATCFVALWNKIPVAFSSWLNIVSSTVRGKREHRTVTLPDYQGVGIGNAVSDFCASLWCAVGFRAFSTTSHPAMIRSRNNSQRWAMRRSPSFSAQGGQAWKEKSINNKVAISRLTAGFEYLGPSFLKDHAFKLLHSPYIPLT